MLIGIKSYFERNHQISQSTTMIVQPNSPINLMPDEILFRIFSFFNGKELFINSAVCRRWRRLFLDETLWKTILIKRWPDLFQDIIREYSCFQLYVSQVKTISFLSKNQPKLEHSFLVENFPAMKANKNCLDLIKARFDSEKWYSSRRGRIKLLSATRNVDIIMLNFCLHYFVNHYGQIVDRDIRSIPCQCTILSFHHLPTKKELKSEMVFYNESVTAAIFEFGRLILYRTRADNTKFVSIYNCLPK